jgi:hypothetical protein
MLMKNMVCPQKLTAQLGYVIAVFLSVTWDIDK